MARPGKTSNDAGAEKNAGHVARPGFQLHFIDPQGTHVAIVLQEHRCVQQFLQFFLERHVVPAKIRRENDLAGFRIHRPGRANADGLDLLQVQIAFIHRLADAAGDAPDDLVGAAVGLGADPRARDAFKFFVEYARQDFSAAEIDAHDAIFFFIRSGHRKGLLGLSLFQTHLPARTRSILSCNSALISSTERSPLTMVKP